MTIPHKLKAFVVSVCAALVIYLAYQFISLRSQNYVTTVPRSDCLVVLGAAVWPDGRPSYVLRDRLARAAELYHAGVAGKVITSGGVGRHPPAEALAGKEFLVRAGVPEGDIIMEASSTSTAEQAELIKEICDREGFRKIALVTSFYHEKRATQLFARAGFTDIADARCTHERFADLNYRVARESAILAVMNWWQWAATGLGIGALFLGYRRIRRPAN
ncbi:MAG TPA: YdcF family protein [Pyrinomonadaceae bacterium]|nr:YdcF family protein [Pyrinomonadaceae bacterium]